MPAVRDSQRIAAALVAQHPGLIKKSETILAGLRQIDLEYLEGFCQKCAEHGVDPEAVLSKKAQQDPKALIEAMAELPGKGRQALQSAKGVAGNAARGMLTGGATGAVLGAGAGGAGSLAAIAKMRGEGPKGERFYQHHKQEALKMVLKSILTGAAGGGIAGASTGAVVGSTQR